LPLKKEGGLDIRIHADGGSEYNRHPNPRTIKEALMPETPDEKKLMRSLIKKYGMKKAYAVYHGMKNKKKAK
jgi:hypothetical protein